MPSTATGLLLLIAAGIMNASFSMPMKRTRQWAWENTWLAWTCFALLILPTLAVAAFIPTPLAVYRDAGPAILSRIALFGLGWGIAQVLFGLAIDGIGVAISFSVVLGISAATGSLIPLFRLHQAALFQSAGRALLQGTGLVLLGLTLCAIAGYTRERLSQSSAAVGRTSFVQGLVLAILSGLFAAFMNYGVAFGTPLLGSAVHHGATAAMAMNAIWWPLLAAGSIPNVLYCLFLLKKNGSHLNFQARETRSYWLLALLMAALWLGSTLIYGVASSKLGQLGPAVGWPLFMSVIVLSANGFGAASGEWKQSGRSTLCMQGAGIMFLILAVVAFSRASL